MNYKRFLRIRMVSLIAAVFIAAWILWMNLTPADVYRSRPNFGFPWTMFIGPPVDGGASFRLMRMDVWMPVKDAWYLPETHSPWKREYDWFVAPRYMLLNAFVGIAIVLFSTVAVEITLRKFDRRSAEKTAAR